MKKNSKIYVAGHNGLVGGAVYDALKKKGYKNIIFKRKKDLDLTDKKKVDLFFKKNKPEYLIMCAAKVGGIIANRDLPLEFLLENLFIEINLLLAAKKYNVKKNCFFRVVLCLSKGIKNPNKRKLFNDG